LLGFMIPFLGIGTVPAVVVVILYSLLPIIKNTFTGIDNINPQMLEAAKGIGLTSVQILGKVQIPLALPVIMAGVRISAVTAVGLMTMAAFIGAGGLGYLVFSGIRTVNNSQILAGAIPACILALTVDYLFALIEKLVTPVSLQKGKNAANGKKRFNQKLILLLAGLLIVFAFIFSSINGAINSDKVVVVGSKDYTEQAILGNLVSDMIESHTDITVDRQLDLGGTQVCFSALTTGSIDMYVEYTGTAYSNTLNYPPISDMQQVYETVKKDFIEKYDIVSLNQMNFNNTYVMSVTQETADKYNLATVSDFAKVSKECRGGFTFEFLNRDDGLLGLQKLYNFKVASAVALDGAPRYTALINKEVDIVDAFATDGMLKKFKLVTLEDDQGFFPPYYAMPILRGEIVQLYPELVAVLNQLSGVLTDEVMSELNYRVDELQQSPAVVARDFLTEQGMLKK